jgi:ribosomal-protein-alanine N-acetyltransferase
MKTIVCPALETERLTLRPPEQGDIPKIIRHCGDPRVALKTTAMPHPYRLSDAAGWLDQIEREHESCAGWTYAIELKSATGMIGVISLLLRDDRRSAEIGYWLGVPFWRRGYMTEALREILRHGFEDLRLLYLTAWHMAGNPASGKVMLKARMKFENVVEGGICRDGALHDKVNYGLFADEWRKAP